MRVQVIGRGNRLDDGRKVVQRQVVGRAHERTGELGEEGIKCSNMTLTSKRVPVCRSVGREAKRERSRGVQWGKQGRGEGGLRQRHVGGAHNARKCSNVLAGRQSIEGELGVG